MGVDGMFIRTLTGTIEDIEDVTMENSTGGFHCFQQFTLRIGAEIVYVIVNRDTYIINRELLRIGDEIMVYIDGNAPVPLIYPPQYTAVILAKNVPEYHVKVSYFNDELISEDHQLQLQIGSQTVIQYENGQPYSGSLQDHLLAVVYGPSTRSIPAQTTPYAITVICS